MSLCPGPLRAACLVSHSPLSLWDTIPTDFHSQMLQVLLFPAVVSPGCGAHWGAGTPCSSGGTCTAEVALPFLNCHTIGVGPAHSPSPPLLLF